MGEWLLKKHFRYTWPPGVKNENTAFINLSDFEGHSDQYFVNNSINNKNSELIVSSIFNAILCKKSSL